MSIKAFIRLRLLQAYRIIKEVGWLILILLLFVSIAFISQFTWGLIHSSFEQGLALGVILLSAIHFSRKDLPFLQIHAPNKRNLRRLLLAEYALAIAPFMIITLIGLNWKAATGIGLSVFCSLFFPITRGSFWGKNWNPRLEWVPNRLFEIKSLLRRRFPYLILIYLTGLLSFLHIAFFIICIVLSAVFLTSAYEAIEPPALIRWDKRFFSRKISLNTKYVQAAFLPIYSLTIIFHPNEYLFPLFGIFIIQMVIVFSIFYKYAMYRPQARRLSQSVVHALFFLFLIFPGFQLVCIFLCVWYGIKARKTMAYFWNDQNSTYAKG